MTNGPRPTLVDVARAAGVSTALVSIVMRGVPGASDATRERVKRIADELGYVPDQRARKLRQTRSRLLGVVFELQQPYHGDLVEQLYAAAAARGYDLVISAVAPSRPEPTAVRDLVRERCEAAILLGSRLSDDALVTLTRDVPTLVVARASGIPGVGRCVATTSRASPWRSSISSTSDTAGSPTSTAPAHPDLPTARSVSSRRQKATGSARRW